MGPRQVDGTNAHREAGYLIFLFSIFVFSFHDLPDVLVSLLIPNVATPCTYGSSGFNETRSHHGVFPGKLLVRNFTIPTAKWTAMKGVFSIRSHQLKYGIFTLPRVASKIAVVNSEEQCELRRRLAVRSGSWFNTSLVFRYALRASFAMDCRQGH